MLESRNIRRPSLTDIVVETIKTAIRNGDLKSGDRLPSHEELSERWGISRTTVREALNKLESLGVLAKHQGRGTFLLDTRLQQMVTAQKLSGILSKEGVLELLEARKLLEISIAGLAAERRSEQDMTSLGAVLEEMTQCLAANDHVGHSLADNRFHLSIAKASRNSFLQSMMRNLQDALVTQQKEVLALSEKAQKKIVQESLLYHQKIHRAIEQQDADQAKRFMQLHLESVERFVREFL